MSIRWPRLLTPTQLSQLIRCQKNPLKALEIFKEAKYRYPTYRHNSLVYGTMINILGSSGRLTEMKEVINQMKQDSCECRDSVIAAAIKTYARVGLLDEAISLFRELPQFNCVNWTESFNTVMEILVKESRLDTTYHIFIENASCWEVKGLTRSLNLLIYALCRVHRSDLALHIFQEMEHHCCYPNKETYKTLMKGLCENGRLTEATHLLYSMFWRISRKGSGEDIAVYRTLLDALCDNGEVDEAVEILNKILRKGLKAPKQCQKLLDHSHLQPGDGANTESVKGLINQALIKGIVPNSDSYKAMAIDLYSEGKIVEGDKVLNEIYERGFRPSVSIYEARVDALCKVGGVDEAVGMIKTVLPEKNCIPTIKIYNSVVQGLCNEQKYALALKYFEEMSRQVGRAPSKETYTFLVDGLCREAKFIEASLILEQMLIHSYWPAAEIYNKLIHGLCDIGNTYKALLWLEEMISQAKIPEISVWSSLVSSIFPKTLDTGLLSITIEKLRKSC